MTPTTARGCLGTIALPLSLAQCSHVLRPSASLIAATASLDCSGV
jgi:hypothetical protein